MAEAPLLEISRLRKAFGAVIATDDLSLTVQAGEIHAIIGPNGAGKTTLISQLTGDVTPDSGTIRFAGQDITSMPTHRRAQRGLARSFQITSILPGFTVLENAAIAAQAHAGHSFRFFGNASREVAVNAAAMAALTTVGLADRAGRPAKALSHGEKRQLELAIALATQPKLLLLDEPMAGVGREETAAMVTMLQALRSDYTMLLVEHDMDAVFALADRITVLVYGRAIATGSPDDIRNDPAVRAAYLGEEQAA